MGGGGAYNTLQLALRPYNAINLWVPFFGIFEGHTLQLAYRTVFHWVQCLNPKLHTKWYIWIFLGDHTLQLVIGLTVPYSMESNVLTRHCILYCHCLLLQLKTRHFTSAKSLHKFGLFQWISFLISRRNRQIRKKCEIVSFRVIVPLWFRT